MSESRLFSHLVWLSLLQFFVLGLYTAAVLSGGKTAQSAGIMAAVMVFAVVIVAYAVNRRTEYVSDSAAMCVVIFAGVTLPGIELLIVCIAVGALSAMCFYRFSLREELKGKVVWCVPLGYAAMFSLAGYAVSEAASTAGVLATVVVVLGPLGLILWIGVRQFWNCFLEAFGPGDG